MKLLFTAFALADALGDLERARTKVPRDDYRGSDRYSTGKALNKHLEKAHLNLKSCSEFTVAELQLLQAELHLHREEAHNDIYEELSDNRVLRFSSLEGYRAHWDEMNEHAATHPNIAKMQRDGHCHEIVMWFVHHLTEVKRQSLSHLTIPRMPTSFWREPILEEGASAKAMYDLSYNPSSTCLACHGGGIPWQNDDNEPSPFPRQVNNKDRARRCDEYYGKDEEECNACEGMAGYYWGDMPDFTDPIACEIVKNASDVPKEERAPTAWPHMFSVEMRGSDRWPRASPSSNASCNYTTDCSPYNASQEGQPNPPTVWGHWYAGIRGTLYLDHNPGQYGGGLLRHETVYQFPAGEAGRDRQAKGLQGERNMHLTEIHVQTPEMAAEADPGIMLNLVHMNWTNPDRSGMTTINDDYLDWRRLPSPPLTDQILGKALCVCVPDPAGLPDFVGAYSNATYKGRVSFIPPWQQTGSYGPPSTKPVVADHWVKWTFHLFVDVETKLPVLFSSPFGGIATYGNFSKPDELWPKDFNGGWRNLPERDQCFDPTHGAATCRDYIPTTTAPPVTTAPATTVTTTKAGRIPKFLTIDFVVNLMDNLVNDQSEVQLCILGALAPVGDAVNAMEDINATLHDKDFKDFLKALDDLGDLFHDAVAAVDGCSPAARDAKATVAVLKQIKGLKDAVAQIKKNFHDDDQNKIMQDFEDLLRAFKGEDYATAGTDLGQLLHRLLIAAKYPDEVQKVIQV